MVLCTSAPAQNFSTKMSTPPPPSSAEFSSERIVVDVSLVDVFFNVRNSDHQLLTGLPRDEFQLIENGRPQEIRYFSDMTEQPLRIALLLDTSGSQSRVLNEEKMVAASFFEQVLGPGDEGMLVSFDSDIELRQDFTASPDDLRAALNETQRISSKNSASLGAVGHPKMRSTALYDAIHLTAKHKLRSVNGRKVFIIITDGEDQGSAVAATKAIDEAIKASAACYVLLVADSAVSGGVHYTGEKKMAELATRTGGRLIRVGHRLKELPKHFTEISQELRMQYSLGYTPSDLTSTGEYRTIEVRSKRGYQVQSRQGYFARFDISATNR
jgi:VWFA-related protein